MLEVVIGKVIFHTVFKIDRSELFYQNSTLGLRDMKRIGLCLDLLKEEVTFAGTSFPPLRLLSDQEIARVK